MDRAIALATAGVAAVVVVAVAVAAAVAVPLAWDLSDARRLQSRCAAAAVAAAVVSAAVVSAAVAVAVVAALVQRASMPAPALEVPGPYPMEQCASGPNAYLYRSGYRSGEVETGRRSPPCVDRTGSGRSAQALPAPAAHKRRCK